MNRRILKIYFPDFYGDIEVIFILIIYYLQHKHVKILLISKKE